MQASERLSIDERTSKTWVFDTVHSSIHFSVRRLAIGRVRGQFTKWRGSMVFDESSPSESSLAVRIDSASIDTNDPERDTHLRSPDFLHAGAHPSLTYASTRVESRGGNRLAVTGLLCIRGTTREVTLDVEYRGMARDAWGNERLGFGATTAILRHEFGLKYNEVLPGGELFVGNEIEISIEIEAMRSPSGSE